MNTKKSIFFLTSVSLLLVLSSFLPGRPSEAGLVEDVLSYTNKFRKQKGKPALEMNARLNELAQKHSANMASGKIAFGHAGFADRQQAAAKEIKGISAFAENVAYGATSGKEVVEGWKKSSGHAANLVMPQATRMGIALAKNPQTRYGAWWTIVLAAEPEKRQELSAGPLVPASGRGTTTFRWGPPL